MIYTKKELDARYVRFDVQEFKDNRGNEITIIDLRKAKDEYCQHVRIIFADKAYVSGDYGSWVFGENIHDPKKFFNNDVNAGYWAEKLEAVEKGFYDRKYDFDKVRKACEEHFIENELYDFELPEEPDRNTEQSMFDAVADAFSKSGLEQDGESIHYIVDSGKKEYKRYMIICEIMSYATKRYWSEKENG